MFENIALVVAILIASVFEAGLATMGVAPENGAIGACAGVLQMM